MTEARTTMTEAAPTAAERCISILLHDIMHYLNLWDLLLAMGVNRFWREHAINHPTYYGDICMFQLALQDVDFFLLRLSRSAGRPISIHVDLCAETPLSLVEEIGSHLAHITSLTVATSWHWQHPAQAVLKHFCCPAPILRSLYLRFGAIVEKPNAQRQSSIVTLPADFLANNAPVLDHVELGGLDLSLGIPDCFSNIRALRYFGIPGESEVVLPSPFERCPRLRELFLANDLTLHPDACRATREAWKRMTDVSFWGRVYSRWPTLRLPLLDIPRVTVHDADADGVLSLANTLPAGPLHVAFPPPRRISPVVQSWVHGPYVHYTAILRNLDESSTADRVRVIKGTLTEHGCISAFSAPSLADRIVRLDIALEAWADFVGLSTFGPFNALDTLVLNLSGPGSVAFQRGTAVSKLSCPQLQRLVLHGVKSIPAIVADVAAVAEFARAALPEARSPLSLDVDGVELTGRCDEFSETFSSCDYPLT